MRPGSEDCDRARGRDNRVPRPTESLRDARADALGGARHDRDLVREARRSFDEVGLAHDIWKAIVIDDAASHDPCFREAAERRAGAPNTSYPVAVWWPRPQREDIRDSARPLCPSVADGRAVRRSGKSIAGAGSFPGRRARLRNCLRLWGSTQGEPGLGLPGALRGLCCASDAQSSKSSGSTRASPRCSRFTTSSSARRGYGARQARHQSCGRQNAGILSNPGEAQAILTPLTEAAIFLVLTVDSAADDATRALLVDVSGLRRSVGFRNPEAGLTCLVGLGSELWDRLFGTPRPAALHPFPGFAGTRHAAIATPGDLLFHIRAARLDLF